MFIQTQPTPNPASLMFYPGKPVMEVGSADFPNARSAMNAPLAKSLYGIDGEIFFLYYFTRWFVIYENQVLAFLSVSLEYLFMFKSSSVKD